MTETPKFKLGDYVIVSRLVQTGFYMDDKGSNQPSYGHEECLGKQFYVAGIAPFDGNRSAGYALAEDRYGNNRRSWFSETTLDLVEPQRVSIPAADPKILEDALKEVFRIVYGVHVHGEKKERLPFALAYITEQLEKYRSGGEQNG
jgi:hypothetical protein